MDLYVLAHRCSFVVENSCDFPSDMVWGNQHAFFPLGIQFFIFMFTYLNHSCLECSTPTFDTNDDTDDDDDDDDDGDDDDDDACLPRMPMMWICTSSTQMERSVSTATDPRSWVSAPRCERHPTGGGQVVSH